MSLLRIAVDVMGGDLGSQSTLPAVVMAAHRYPSAQFQLYGESSIQSAVDALRTSSCPLTNVRFIATEIESVSMDESPKNALRHKRGSSMGLAVKAVADGDADGCISAGNTGALVAMGMHFLKCYKGVERPALCKAIPVVSATSLRQHSYLLDLGANVDCSSSQLQQFACLGSMLCSLLDKKEAPVVHLLNVGSEVFKGSTIIQASAELLENTQGLNYQGFLEGNDIFQGITDVIVCDGFSGNVALKVSEGVARSITSKLKELFHQRLYYRVMAWLSRPILRRWQASINPDRYNGAYLLGLKGTVIKSHGSANTQQFAYALDMLIEQVQQQVDMVDEPQCDERQYTIYTDKMEKIFFDKFAHNFI